MPIKPELVKLRKQYGDAYIPDSDGCVSSESEAVMTSVIYEREVGFLLSNLAIYWTHCFQLQPPSWAVSNYSPEPESYYQRSLSYHEESVDRLMDRLRAEIVS